MPVSSDGFSRRRFLGGGGGAPVDPVHISSVLLRADPARRVAVTETIADMEIADVQHADDNGRIIVTLETSDESQIVDALNKLNLIDGVVSAALVYHEIDA